MVTTRQVKAARALLGWSQGDLAAASGISEATIARLEATEGPFGGRAGTAERILGAFKQAGIAFAEGPEIGVSLKPVRRADEGLRPQELNAANDG